MTIPHAQEECNTSQVFSLSGVVDSKQSQRRLKSNHYPAQLTNLLASDQSRHCSCTFDLHEPIKLVQPGPGNLCGGSRVINLRYLPGFTICLQTLGTSSTRYYLYSPCSAMFLHFHLKRTGQQGYIPKNPYPDSQ